MTRGKQKKTDRQEETDVKVKQGKNKEKSVQNLPHLYVKKCNLPFTKILNVDNHTTSGPATDWRPVEGIPCL